jgi:hypothetical protein
MRQLVGSSCALCNKQIASNTDGRFCDSCGCPVHTRCVRPVPPTDTTPRCAGCGAAVEYEENKDRQNDTDSQKRLVFGAGIVGFSIMTISALNSTLHPEPDGRLLNTAPSLGFDLFLPIGLLGIGFCVYGLVWGPGSRDKPKSGGS